MKKDEGIFKEKGVESLRTFFTTAACSAV